MAVNLIEKELLEIVYSYRKAQLLYVAAKLGISAILADGPKSSDEIAKCTDTDPDALYRVLRALSVLGIYKENAKKHFELTAKGALLQKDAPSPVWINVIMRMEEYNWRPWGELLYSVKTGNSAFEKIFGMNLFEYLADNPEASHTFSEAMGVYTQNGAKGVLENYDFSSYRIIADIGGNNGELLKQILAKHIHLQGVLFDLPTVIQKIHFDVFEPDILRRLLLLPQSLRTGPAAYSCAAQACLLLAGASIQSFALCRLLL